jgi:hypothetical protein
MADKSKNTGTGGIDIDGKAYAMDVGLPDSSGGPQGNWSPGDISVDNTTKDITAPTRETFAKYLSRSTLAKVGSATHPNKYPVGKGDATEVKSTTIRDQFGNPLRPGQSLNEAQFSQPVNLTMGAPPPLAMKKGLAPGNDPDGNSLLPNAAALAPSGGKYVKNSAGLKDLVKGYTKTLLEPNLYSPLDDPAPTPVVVSSGGLNESPQNLRTIRHIDPASSPATDGGTSKNILGPDGTGKYTLTPEEQGKLAQAATVDNKFPVDAAGSPSAKLTDPQGNPLPVSAAQNNIGNTKFFSKEIIKVNNQNYVTSKIQSSYTDALTEAKPDFSIKRGKESGGVGPDGNELLPNIAIKDEITGQVNLTPGAATYTTKVLDPNLHSPVGQGAVTTANKVVIGDGGDVPPDNIRNVNVMLVGDPLGDSSVTMNPKAVNSLTLRERAEYAAAQTADAPGPSGANAYPVDPPSPVFNPVALTDANGNPVPPSPAPENSQYFTKDIGAVPSLQTYTPALAEAAQANNEAFLLKRGKSSVEGVDGNQLLPGIAPIDNGTAKLTPEAETYLEKVLEPNLRSPFDNGAQPIEDFAGENGFAGGPDFPGQNIVTWPLHITATPGSSDEILSPTSATSLTLLEAQGVPRIRQFSRQTYIVDPADPPNASGQLPLSSLTDGAASTPSVTDQQNNPKNSDYFTKGKNLSTSYSDSVNDLEIKRGRVAGEGPDGNKLLPDAASSGGTGGPYVKPSGGLKDPIKKYVQNVFGKNLYVPGSPYNSSTGDDHSTVENASNLSKEDFYGPKNLHLPLGGNDMGTFDNIRTDPGSNLLDQKSAQSRGQVEMSGVSNVPGGIANEFRPAADTPEKTSIVTPEGYPSSPRLNDDEGLYISGKEVNQNWGPSDAYTASKLREKLRKGKGASSSDASLPNGNDILQDVKGNAPKKDAAGPVGEYVSEVIKHNRFSRKNPFYSPILADGPDKDNNNDLGDPDFSTDDSAGGDQLMKKNSYALPDQMQYGKSLGNDDKFARPYDFKRLSKIGTILQLRAAGEIQTLINESTEPRDGGLTQLAALAPGLGQIGAGAPLSSEFLNIKQIIADLPPDDEATTDRYKGTLLDFNTKFEGVINNVFDKFSGFTALGMIATCTVLVAAITVVFSIFGGLIGIKDETRISGEAPKRLSKTGRAGMGTFYGVGTGSSPDDIINAFLPVGGDSSVLLRFFGIMPTQGPFGTAAANGVKAFFGLGDDYSPLTTFQSPGHFVVQARAIVRSALEIALAFKDLVELFASGNVFSGIEQIFEILYIIKKSRFISSLNIFAQIGDAFAKMQPDIDNSVIGLDAGKKYSKMDSESDDQSESSIRKNRLNKTNKEALKLAWASNRTPDKILVSLRSAALSALAPSLNAGKLLTNDPLQKTRFIYAEDEAPARISTAEREKAEREFDAEYLPFYFHDLRTNEILGFHAFLTSLSDDYSVSYDSAEGIGRIDSIKTYKNTSRKIGLSFIVAATDTADFDSMWLKINKLTTMVYPQYTEGRKITIENNDTFTRPFSQLVSAAPMVRLRVGNLIASNYSKFNLAGIFGLTGKDASIGGKTAKGVGEKYKETLEKLKNGELDKFFYKKGYKFTISLSKPLSQISDVEKAFDSNENIEEKTADPSKEQGFLGNYDFSAYPGLFYARIESEKNISAINYVAIKLVEVPVTGRPDSAALQRQYREEKERQSLPDITTAIFLVPKDSLIEMFFDDKKSFNTDVFDSFGEAGTYAKNVQAFMNDAGENSNIIAKSFRSAGGKGLAGFIDSINFDWFNSTTWDVDLGRKAPKMCKVTISFSPVHDISPGLDADGVNRAPIYPLGPYKLSEQESNT